MAKIRKSRGVKRNSFTLPMAVVAGFMPPMSRAYNAFKGYGFSGLGSRLSQDFTGFNPNDGSWNPSLMQYGLLPVSIGVLIHKLASAFGINRAIAAAGIPLLRI